jgi:hypothetical protein
MANEIIEVTRDPMKGGGLRVRVLLTYNISGNPVAFGANVIPLTPRESLSVEARDYGLLSPAQLQGLDNGLGVVLERHVEQMDGEPQAQLLARIRGQYQKGLVWIEQQRRRWDHAGNTYDA